MQQHEHLTRLNADFAMRAFVDTNEVEWTGSPAEGVERKKLERIGGERARATTLVRYKPGSSFPEHSHPFGEEVLVVSGIYSDEHGEFPAGSYIRAPWGSKHAPRCEDGCVIFVKQRQLPAGEARLVIDTDRMDFAPSDRLGITHKRLFQSARERVCIERWAPGTALVREEILGGKEVFVLQGQWEDELGEYRKGSWLRLPVGSRQLAQSRLGCTLWVKRGHLEGI